MVVIFNISVHGEKCGSTPLLYQAVRTAKLKAQRMGVAVDVDAITEDGQMVRCASSGCSNRSMPVD